ncbi:hypothetical protein [Streptomyces sp. NPDC050560]
MPLAVSAALVLAVVATHTATVPTGAPMSVTAAAGSEDDTGWQ